LTQLIALYSSLFCCDGKKKKKMWNSKMKDAFSIYLNKVELEKEIGYKDELLTDIQLFHNNKLEDYTFNR